MIQIARLPDRLRRPSDAASFRFPPDPVLMSRRLLAIATLAILSGCATSRQASSVPLVDRAAIARSVVLCSTTEADLRAGLGPPTRDGRLHGLRVVSWVTGEDTVVHFLAVMLDASGRVVDLYWDVPSEIPWTPASQCQ